MKTFFTLMLTLILSPSVLGFNVSKIAKPRTDLNQPYYVSEVIDARYSAYLGLWNDGYANHEVHVPIGSISDHFQTLFGSAIDSPSSEIPLTVRINYFNLESNFQPAGNPSLSGINLSFLKKEGDQYIELFQAAEHIHWTEIHKGQVYQAITRLIGQTIESFNTYLEKGLFTETVIPSSEIMSVNYVEPSHESLGKGLYLNYYSYRDNRPDTGYHAKYLKTGGGTKEKPFVKLSQVKPEKTENIFGFNNGKSVYFGMGKLFVPSTLENNQAVIDYSRLTKNEMLLITVSCGTYWSYGLVGGLVGGALIQAHLNHKKNQRSAQFYDQQTSILDHRTGALIPAERFEEVRSEKDYSDASLPQKKVFVLTENFSRKGDTIQLNTSDSVQFNLTRGQYQCVYIPQSKQHAEFSFTSADNEIKTIQIERTNPSVKIIRLTVTRNGLFKVNQPRPELYDDILDKIESEHYELVSQ
jgi:hypothetical protein